MSRLGAVDLDFGDGTYSFRLRMRELIELDEKCEVGPQKMLIEMSDNNARVTWVREIVRLGLIGGGEKPTDALKLVRNYVDERPFMESVLHAQAILGAAVVGFPDDAPPEKQQAPEADDQTQTDE